MERTCKRCGKLLESESAMHCPECRAARQAEVLQENRLRMAVRRADKLKAAAASAPADMAGALRAAITEKQFVVINKKLAVSIAEYLEKQ